MVRPIMRDIFFLRQKAQEKAESFWGMVLTILR